MKFYTNNYLVSCAPADHVICIWDTDTFRLIKTIRGKQDPRNVQTFVEFFEICYINIKSFLLLYSWFRYHSIEYV